MYKLNFNNLKSQIIILIAKDELEKAIDLLSKYFNNTNGLDSIVIQSARYYELKKERMGGLIEDYKVHIELNKLRQDILSFLRI